MSIYKNEREGMGVTYEVIEHLAVLEEYETGWRKELNIVNWNDNGPKYDIRDWSPTYEQMGRGVVLTREQIDKLTLGFMKHIVTERCSDVG